METVLYIVGIVVYTVAVFFFGANNRWTAKKIERKADELLKTRLGL